jgi:hypothetical protein
VDYAAHRFSFEIHHGKLLPGLFVCHRCDVRRCVNPDHLFAGTPLDNQLDSQAKGRSVRGEKVNTAVLSREDVAEIRRLFSTTVVTKASLARKFHVGESAIYRIVTGKSWRLTLPPGP